MKELTGVSVIPCRSLIRCINCGSVNKSPSCDEDRNGEPVDCRDSYRHAVTFPLLSTHFCVSPEKRNLIECCSFLWPCFTDALQSNAINRIRVGVYVRIEIRPCGTAIQGFSLVIYG